MKSLSLHSFSILFSIYSLLVTTLFQCSSPQFKESREDQFIEVVAQGLSVEDAETEAKLQIVERGLGTLVDGNSVTSDGELLYRVTNSYTQGYVLDYQKLSQEKLSRGGYSVRAKGKPNLKAIGSALEQRRKEIGSPKMLILMKENMFGTLSKAGSTKSEYIFQETLKKDGFQFDDKEQVMKILSKEKGLEVGAYGNPKAEELAQKVAVELNADILVIGDALIKNGGEIRTGTGLYSIQADMKYKLLDVNSGAIIATATDNLIHPDVDQDLGSTEVLKKLTTNLAPRIKEQIARDWKAGSTTRITFKGIKLGDFLASDTTDVIKKIRGVNSVEERGNQGSGPTIEVKCFCGKFDLVKKILRHNSLMDLELEVVDQTGNSITFDAKKR